MDLFLAWLDAFLASNVAKMVIVPAVIAALGGIGYLVKRRIEKQKPAPPDELADLQRVLTFKEKLDQTRTTLDDLRTFRAELLSKPAQAAVLNAEHFLQVAQRLTDTSAKPSKDSITLERATTQLEMNDASAKSAVAVDQALSKLVDEMLTTSPPVQQDALAKSQAAWTAWRDAEVTRSSALYEGGSIRPLVVNTHYEAITRERIASLQTDMLSPEGPKIVDVRRPTPTNLLNHVMPGTPAEKVRSWLGAPTAIHGEVWIYRYIETQVQVTVNDKDVVKEVVIALIYGQTYRGTGASWGDFVLGEMTLADALDYGGVSVEYRDSMRTKELYVNVRTGPPDAWSESACGALVVHTGVGALAPVEFEWDTEKNELVSDPREIKVNWIAEPMGWPDPPYVYWFIEG